MKQNILIIGAGQLGSRHLQGVLKSTGTHSIIVVDPSEESLQLAENRAKEIDHNHEIQYLKAIQDIPPHIKIAIIATNADVREKAIIQLLDVTKVDFLILEKVLFQEVDAYRRISDLLKLKNTKVWVNHSRRMFTHYQELRNQFSTKKSPLTYNITGSNWGLGCNALHFIDLVCYLSNAKLNSLETNWLNKEINPSKRINNIEFTGTLKGTISDGSVFTISSFNDDPSGITIFISSANESWTIRESEASQIIYCLNNTTSDPTIIPIITPFQSELTTILASKLMDNGECDLPSYEEAQISHSFFIESMLAFYNEITNQQSKTLRIT